MLDTYDHLFLIPMKDVDIELINKVSDEYCEKSRRLSFLISLPNKKSADFCRSFFDKNENVHIIHPDSQLDRTAHWKFLVDNATRNFNFKTFSFYFCGDDLLLENFPSLEMDSDLYINDYFINSWVKLKENTSERELNIKSTEQIIKTNFIKGRPLLAPLQKIIFSKKTIHKIYFKEKYGYVSDQLMIYNLMESGFKIKFIKSPFYKLNEKKRAYLNTLSIFEIIKQQVYLYRKIKCYVGIPMIVLRTIVKFCIIDNLKKHIP
ncbi:hypothetical protein IAQ00_08355 [Pantoea ananatis]|uniref:hypothetical protein n=1 Tax=Pantoea ananas TaxID=553 RepID=UPI00207AFC16|nr:hypothetical protein [Pantoea ananatis]MCW0351353.1 hypothetical protein [Pantoea ananatis]USL59751.1 hypothetical protein IAQ00_08355 [Pantoea ananatis]